MTRRPETLLALLTALALTATACKTTGDTPEDPAPTEDTTGGETTGDESKDDGAEAANTLLTGTTVGPFDIDAEYALTKTDSEFYSVDLAPGVEGISLDGKVLCEILVSAREYRTADGLGIGSRAGDLGEPGVDMFIEEANGQIHSDRTGFSVTPSQLTRNADGSEAIDPEATVVDIRLGGCGE